MKIEEKLKALNLELPPAPPLGGVYQPVVIVGNMLYVSGQGPMRMDGTKIIGRVGEDMTLEDGYLAAKQVGLTMLSTIQSQIGDLDKIKRLVKTLGMVNCSPDFKSQPKVINGYSELMREVFGAKNGVGARSAVGMMLPGGIAVEIEAIFELHV